MTQKYTVVLMRPCGDESIDIVDRLYVAIGIEAADCYEAERLGKLEACGADRFEARQQGCAFDREPHDYTMLCIFVGVHAPKWFGFQNGFNTGHHIR